MATIEKNKEEKVNEAWQSIAGLSLCLHDSVHFYKHDYRGETWLVIADQNEESYFRCGIAVETFLRLLDGQRTVGQAFAEALSIDDDLITQQDIVLLIANLKSSNLLNDDEANTTQSSTSKKNVNAWLRPFSIKFALCDPDRFLNKTIQYIKPFLGSSALMLWLVLVAVAITLAFLNWAELVDHGQARFNDPKNLLWYWLLYPIVKTLHELGHAYTTKAWGGVVREMGIMLLVFFPVPYVDSSAAHRFSSKRHRIAVSAAGIMVEVFLASLAMIFWVSTESGLGHDLAFDIIMIGGVSTVLFNANPLLRFDGYYIFNELIEIPNLGTRSSQYLGYLFKNYALGIDGLQSPVTAKGEAKWLVSYGIGAAIYRLFISLFIAVWVAGKFFIFGLILAFWAIIMQLIYPTIMWFSRLIPIVRSAHKIKRLALIMSMLFAVVLLGLLTPISHTTYAEGMVKLPENALIRAGADGVVSQVYLNDSEVVESGTSILSLENIDLDTQRKILLAKLEEVKARQKEALLLDRTQADIAKAKVLSIQTELNDIHIQIKSLTVRSTINGIVSLPLVDDLPGRFIKRGDVIGYIADLRQVSANVVIPQSSIAAVRGDSQSIQVRLRSRADEIVNAELIRELPQMTDQLPSRLLGTGAGGDIAIDTRDEKGTQAMSNIYQVEIALPVRSAGHYLGQRVYVQFIHQRKSLGEQLLHRLNQRLLQPPFV